MIFVFITHSLSLFIASVKVLTSLWLFGNNSKGTRFIHEKLIHTSASHFFVSANILIAWNTLLLNIS